MPRIQFLAGDSVPYFHCPTTLNPKFCFDSIGGRYLVLCFYGSTQIEKNSKVIEFINTKMSHHFNDSKIGFFGICIDPQDSKTGQARDRIPGIRYFWDFDFKLSKLYGAMDASSNSGSDPLSYNSFTLVLDPNMRVIQNIPINDVEEHNKALATLLETLPEVNDYAGVPITAPILVIPRVLDLEFCRELIDFYHKNGGIESGSMIEKDGKTIGRIDYGFKRRMDCNIEDLEIRSKLNKCIGRTILPQIQKAFQFNATYIERYIIACYRDDGRGFFKPHRDNTLKGTAHRRFACTINLNEEEYEGGDLRFPEFGNRTYRAPTGGAVIFSCSLLHEATPVTRGVRYATLPFLYDDAAAEIRHKNLGFLSEEVIHVNHVN